MCVCVCVRVCVWARARAYTRTSKMNEAAGGSNLSLDTFKNRGMYGRHPRWPLSLSLLPLDSSLILPRHPDPVVGSTLL